MSGGVRPVSINSYRTPQTLPTWTGSGRGTHSEGRCPPCQHQQLQDTADSPNMDRVGEGEAQWVEVSALSASTATGHRRLSQHGQGRGGGHTVRGGVHPVSINSYRTPQTLPTWTGSGRGTHSEGRCPPCQHQQLQDTADSPNMDRVGEGVTQWVEVSALSASTAAGHRRLSQHGQGRGGGGTVRGGVRPVSINSCRTPQTLPTWTGSGRGSHSEGRCPPCQHQQLQDTADSPNMDRVGEGDTQWVEVSALSASTAAGHRRLSQHGQGRGGGHTVRGGVHPVSINSYRTPQTLPTWTGSGRGTHSEGRCPPCQHQQLQDTADSPNMDRVGEGDTQWVEVSALSASTATGHRRLSLHGQGRGGGHTVRGGVHPVSINSYRTPQTLPTWTGSGRGTHSEGRCPPCQHQQLQDTAGSPNQSVELLHRPVPFWQFPHFCQRVILSHTLVKGSRHGNKGARKVLLLTHTCLSLCLSLSLCACLSVSVSLCLCLSVCSSRDRPPFCMVHWLYMTAWRHTYKCLRWKSLRSFLNRSL